MSPTIVDANLMPTGNELADLARILDTIAQTLRTGFHDIGSDRHAMQVDAAATQYRNAAITLKATNLSKGGQSSLRNLLGISAGPPGASRTSVQVNTGDLRRKADHIQRILDSEEEFNKTANAHISAMSADWQGTDYIAFVAQWERMAGKGSSAEAVRNSLRAYKDLLTFAVSEYHCARQTTVSPGAGDLLLYQSYNYYIQDGRWKELIRKPAEEISDLEYHVLALIYMEFSPDRRYDDYKEIEGFICGMIDRTDLNQLTTGFSSVWSVNQDKIHRIAGILDAHTAILMAQISELSAMSDQELWEALRERFDIPDQARMAGYRERYIKDLYEEIYAIQQKKQILTTVSQINTYRHSGDRITDPDNKYPIRWPGLICANANEDVWTTPAIEIGRGRDRGTYSVKYLDSPYSIRKEDTWKIIQISPCVSNFDALTEYREAVDKKFGEIYEFDLCHSAASGVVNYIGDEARGNLKSRIMDGLAESMADSMQGVSAKAVGKVLGHTWGVVDFVVGLAEEQAQNERNMSDAAGIHDAGVNADLANRFRMRVIVTKPWEDPAMTSFHLVPGPETELVLYNLNVARKVNHMPDPYTLNDLIDNPAKIMKAYNNLPSPHQDAIFAAHEKIFFDNDTGKYYPESERERW